MQPILIRGLKRSFRIDAAWAGTALDYLRATPETFETSPVPEPIAVERAGAVYRTRLPSGQVIEGSLRWLAFRLDQTIQRQALAAETEALHLPAAILRGPNGARAAFVGGIRSGKTWLALALLAAGWSFEGDGWIVTRCGGVVALPRTLRLRVPPRALPRQLRERVEHAPRLRIDSLEEIRAIDPRIFGGDWTLRSDPLAAILFLELNPGGRSSLHRVDQDRAFQRALDLCHGRMTGSAAAALRKAVGGARNFRFGIGRIEDAAEYAMEALTEPYLNGIPH